jgi:hypothetical protein
LIQITASKEERDGTILLLVLVLLISVLQNRTNGSRIWLTVVLVPVILAHVMLVCVSQKNQKWKIEPHGTVPIMIIACRLNGHLLIIPVKTLLKPTVIVTMLKTWKHVVLFLVITVSLKDFLSITWVAIKMMIQEISTTDPKITAIPQTPVVMPVNLTLTSPSRTMAGVVVT